jgi:hypothetical protein
MLDFIDVLEVATHQKRIIPRAWLDIPEVAALYTTDVTNPSPPDCCGQAAASALSASTPD